jgi:hypothetical protein
MTDKRFYNQILEFCVRKRSQRNKRDIRVYRLKDEWKNKLSQVVEFGKKRKRLDDEDDEDQDENGIVDENEDDANDNACDWGAEEVVDDGDKSFEGAGDDDGDYDFDPNKMVKEKDGGGGGTTTATIAEDR